MLIPIQTWLVEVFRSFFLCKQKGVYCRLDYEAIVIENMFPHHPRVPKEILSELFHSTRSGFELSVSLVSAALSVASRLTLQEE